MIYRKWTIVIIMAIALAVGSGCVYRANIAQGNLIKEEDLAQLEIGMTNAQFKRWVSVFFEGDVVREIRKDQELAPGL
jgi:hypothetical protein